MKGEHYKSIEEYLIARGWLESRELGGYWQPQSSVQKYSMVGALSHQLSRDLDPDEGGLKVTGITLERA